MLNYSPINYFILLYHLLSQNLPNFTYNEQETPISATKQQHKPSLLLLNAALPLSLVAEQPRQ